MLRISAEDWRRDLPYPRERSGVQAKTTADALARRVIEWSGAPRLTSGWLARDAAGAAAVSRRWINAWPMRGIEESARTRTTSRRLAIDP